MRKPYHLLFLLTCICLLAPATGSTAHAQCWEAWYTTPQHLGDIARKVAVDDSGNVYVTGHSWSVSTRDDIATIKYDSEGNQLWVDRYDYEGRSDEPWGIALDRFGNAYVTGESQVYIPSLDASDYVTIKYRPDGTRAWVARYGERERNDEAYAIAVDSSCNVYVTGTSRDTISGLDYATVKYDSLGNELWAARNDIGRLAYAIAVDERGGAFVTGSTGGGWGTVKYDALGNEVWAAHFPSGGEPDALTLDRAGNVYVSGDGFNDFYTVKYDSLGREVWRASYDGPGQSDDDPCAMVMDDSANIYVTGRSRGASSGWDFCTIKYDSAGNERWVARLDTSPGGDIPEAIATDGKSVYVVGRTGQRYCTTRYDAATGSLYWVAIYDNIPDEAGNANGVTVDEDGNAYVTGAQDRPDTYADYLTIKYPPGGVAVAEPEVGLRLKRETATVMRAGALALKLAAMPAGARPRVLDVQGRDVSGRAAVSTPGVYFLHSPIANPHSPPATKVIIQR